MKNLTVIIPIIELNDSYKYQSFLKAVKSVGEGTDILVVGDDAAIKSAARPEGVAFDTLVNTTGDVTCANQINLAAKSIKTKYFSVLEYDDTYSPIWFSNVEKYMEADVEETFAYLPLTELIDAKTEATIGYSNEAVWASSFSEEIGYFDLQSIEDYFNFNTSGGIFNTEVFLSLGGLKASMKMVEWYEFLMRALYKEKRVYVIPKVGYYHTVNRSDSVSTTLAETMSEKEADWWIELAKKEYFFPQDRKKTYEE